MSTTSEQLLQHLTDLGINTTVTEHEAVFTVEQARALRGEIPGGHCKNLFLKDKKGALWLVVCLEDAVIDLKALPALIGAARISFGKADLLGEVLGVEPGSVTPFALINDATHRVNIVLDAKMMKHDVVSYHPLVNTATVTLTPDDLLKFISSCGHEPRIIELYD
ncbi:MAG: prolyl-tRNA synthetase associated domain-containing protein [Anderseniella sp.]|jgi:Ala-tRNA(Pro) deacylase